MRILSLLTYLFVAANSSTCREICDVVKIVSENCDAMCNSLEKKVECWNTCGNDFESCIEKCGLSFEASQKVPTK